MRILFDSKELCYKTPFGTVRPGEPCTIHIHIPANLATNACELLLDDCRGAQQYEFALKKTGENGSYDIFSVTFSLPKCGLYFYYFRIHAITGPFRLFKQGNDTNMEAGEKWQLSCVPVEHSVPQWARGAVMYQVFPDRYYRKGECDTTEKLKPFWVHKDWYEQPHYLPDEHGEILNNDFFGGNFRGIQEKLPYIRSLGVDILYLNPVVMAFSNHRYDAADFKRTDPMLGTDEDFRSLCEAAHGLGMKIIFDGVFSHTGSNSIYFDAKNHFGGGAVSDPNSRYRSWYQFHHYPDVYESWWGITTLPCIDKNNPDYQDYIYAGEDSVIAHWLRLGVDGFRLDVVDELPDSFVRGLKEKMREINPSALLIGEVWEDASNKEAYGVSRRYFVDGELDSTMNYPWQKAIIRFLRREEGAEGLGYTIMSIAENYPPQVLCCVMNLLGTHDTVRILNALTVGGGGNRMQNAGRTLTKEERKLGVQRLKLASVIQFTLPGIPSVYYGDEAGMEGFADPFNRACFPWGREDVNLQDTIRKLGKLKHDYISLREGDVRVLVASGGYFAFSRKYEDEKIFVCVNRNDCLWDIDEDGQVLFATEPLQDGVMAPNSAAVILCEQGK